MTSRLLSLFIGLWFLTSGNLTPATAQTVNKMASDPKALAIADQVMAAMGGHDA